MSLPVILGSHSDGRNNGTVFTTDGFSTPVLNEDGTYTLNWGHRA